MSENTGMSRGWRVPALIGAGWIGLGIVAGVLDYLASPEPAGFNAGLPAAGLLWVPLTFLAAALSRRFPWPDAGPRRFAIVHGAAALSAGFVLNGAFFTLALLAGVVPLEEIVPQTVGMGVRWMHLHAAGWIGVVTAIHLVEGRVRPPAGALAAASTTPQLEEPPAGARVLVTATPEPVLAVPRGQGGLRLPWSEIDWIEADGDYARVHSGGRAHLISRRMKELESELADPPFVRVHRSTIVHAGRVREVRHRSHGDFEAVLMDGTRVRVSRTRRDALLAVLNERVATAPDPHLSL